VRPRLLGLAPALALGTWIGYAWLPHLGGIGAVRRGPATRRRVALSFDDGPDPRWTPVILEILARHGVRASFFAVGERARRAPDVIRAAAASGHEIGNHGWSHRSLWLCGPRRTQSEVARAHDVLAGIAGRPPRLFRPPWGMVNAALPDVLRACGERAVLWSLQPEGLRPVPARVQVARVLRGIHPGAIVDLHDAEGTRAAPARLAQGLPHLIEGLGAAGYELTTVGALLGLDGAG
jgi:peptidoglycan/xylan/chitin deacetylase (PgdA/CDA1 family)